MIPTLTLTLIALGFIGSIALLILLIRKMRSFHRRLSIENAKISDLFKKAEFMSDTIDLQLTKIRILMFEIQANLRKEMMTEIKKHLKPNTKKEKHR